MKQFKAYAFIILLIVLIIPSVVFALWWNPFSWSLHDIFDTFSKPQTSISNQNNNSNEPAKKVGPLIGKKIIDQPSDVFGAINTDSNGNIYVLCARSNRISKYDQNGNVINLDFIKYVSGFELFLDSNDNLYLSDYHSKTIKKYDKNGTVISYSLVPNNDQYSDLVFAIDKNNNYIYVIDFLNEDENQERAVSKYKLDGSLVAKNIIKGINDDSSEIRVDENGNIYLFQRYDGIISKYDKRGKLLNKKLVFNDPVGGGGQNYGFTLDDKGNIYIIGSVLNGGSPVVMFDKNGKMVNSNLISWTSEDGVFPREVLTFGAKNNSLYIIGELNEKIGPNHYSASNPDALVFSYQF